MELSTITNYSSHGQLRLCSMVHNCSISVMNSVTMSYLLPTVARQKSPITLHSHPHYIYISQD